MRKVTLPELCGIGLDREQQAVAWGFVELFLEFIFTRQDLYSREETIVWMDEMRAKLNPLRGPGQVGVELLLTDNQWNLAIREGFPPPAMLGDSEMQNALGVCRLALIRAKEVEGGVAPPAGGQAPEACDPTDSPPGSPQAAGKRRRTSSPKSDGASPRGGSKRPPGAASEPPS